MMIHKYTPILLLSFELNTLSIFFNQLPELLLMHNPWTKLSQQPTHDIIYYIVWLNDDKQSILVSKIIYHFIYYTLTLLNPASIQYTYLSLWSFILWSSLKKDGLWVVTFATVIFAALFVALHICHLL